MLQIAAVVLAAILAAAQEPAQQPAGPLDSLAARIEKRIDAGLTPVQNSMLRIAERLESIETRQDAESRLLRAAVADLAAKLDRLPAADLGPLRTSIEKLTDRIAAMESRQSDSAGFLAELRQLRDADATQAEANTTRLANLDRIGNLVWLIFFGVIGICGTIAIVAVAYILSLFRK